MPHEEPITHETPAIQARESPAHEPPAYAPIEERDEEWLAEPEELPRRPRGRLLTPVPLALLAVLLTACGFIGGALVEKSQSGSSSSSTTGASAAAFASRLRGVAGGAGGSTGAGSSGSSAGGGLGGARPSGGFTRPTAGTVAYLAGSTLYVTNPEGNTVKVKTSAGTSVTKTVNASVKQIHPGESVTVTGASAGNGSILAESISVGSRGSGLAALFGSSGTSAGSAGSGRGSSGGGGAPTLFGG